MKRNNYLLLLYANISFIAFTALAMLFYPGGKFHNHNSIGYSFIENFFSDLGRWRTYSGDTKYISLCLFAVAIFFLSGAFLNFIFSFVDDIANHKNYPTVKLIAKISTVTFCLLLCGVALTPYDLVFNAHLLDVRVCFIMMVPVSWSISYLIYQDHTLPNKYMSLLFFVSIALIVYIYILFFGPRVSDNKYFQPIAQKSIVYLLSFSLIYVAHGCNKYLKK